MDDKPPQIDKHIPPLPTIVGHIKLFIAEHQARKDQEELRGKRSSYSQLDLETVRQIGLLGDNPSTTLLERDAQLRRTLSPKQAWTSAVHVRDLDEKRRKSVVENMVSPEPLYTLRDRFLRALPFMPAQRLAINEQIAKAEISAVESLAQQTQDLRKVILAGDHSDDIMEHYIQSMHNLTSAMYTYDLAYKLASGVAERPGVLRVSTTRRGFVKLAVAGTLSLVGLAASPLTSAEVRAANANWDRRKAPAGVTEETEMNYGNWEDLKKFWSDIVIPRYGDQFSSDTWSQALNPIVQLANFSYQKEKHLPDGQIIPFEQYVEQYLLKAFNKCEQMGMNFIAYCIVQKISSDNIGNWEGQIKDIEISKLQQMLGAYSRFFGLESATNYFVTNKLAPTSLQEDVAQRIARALHRELPMNFYDGIRFLGPTTFGIMDMHVEFYAEGMLKPDGNGSFTNRYGSELTPAWRDAVIEDASIEVLQRRANLETKRTALQEMCRTFSTERKTVFAGFFDINSEEKRKKTFSRIGLSFPLDSWQRNNPTKTWVQAVAEEWYIRNKKDQEYLINNVIHGFQYTLDRGISLELQLMQDQINNPAFREYLRAELEAQQDNEGLALFQKVEDSFYDFEKAAQELRDKVAEAEGLFYQNEYNSDFQLEISIAAIKMLQDKVEARFGPINQTKADHVGFAVFCIAAMREIAPPQILAEGTFARLPKVDPVHDDDDVLQLIQQFTDRLVFDPRGDAQFKLFRKIYHGARDGYAQGLDDYIDLIKPTEPNPSFPKDSPNQIIPGSPEDILNRKSYLAQLLQQMEAPPYTAFMRSYDITAIFDPDEIVYW